jgi:hypothetical protein
MMKNKKVMTSRGEVVAIGELKIRNSEEFPYEVPRLSYIITREAENMYASTCIDLHVDGDGITPDKADENMRKNVFEFLCVNFDKDRSNGPAWDYLRELSTIDENSKESWDAFNRFKVDLAQNGRKTDWASELMEKISALREEIARLTDLNTTKEEELKALRIQGNKQKEEIERLEQEKQMLEEILAIAKNLVTFQGVKAEMYHYNWPINIKKR